MQRVIKAGFQWHGLLSNLQVNGNEKEVMYFMYTYVCSLFSKSLGFLTHIGLHSLATYLIASGLLTQQTHEATRLIDTISRHTVSLLTLSPISKQWCYKNVYNSSNSILHEAQTAIAELCYQAGSSQGHHWTAASNPHITSNPSICCKSTGFWYFRIHTLQICNTFGVFALLICK